MHPDEPTIESDEVSEDDEILGGGPGWDEGEPDGDALEEGGIDQPRDGRFYRRKSAFREYLEAFLIAVIFATFARTYVVQAFKIPTGSMQENLLIGDHILVNKFIYAPTATPLERFLLPHREIRRGDVVVFKYPEDPSRDFIGHRTAGPVLLHGRQSRQFARLALLGRRPGELCQGPRVHGLLVVRRRTGITGMARLLGQDASAGRCRRGLLRQDALEPHIHGRPIESAGHVVLGNRREPDET